MNSLWSDLLDDPGGIEALLKHAKLPAYDEYGSGDLESEKDE